MNFGLIYSESNALFIYVIWADRNICTQSDRHIRMHARTHTHNNCRKNAFIKRFSPRSNPAHFIHVLLEFTQLMLDEHHNLLLYFSHLYLHTIYENSFLFVQRLPALCCIDKSSLERIRTKNNCDFNYWHFLKRKLQNEYVFSCSNNSFW